jgi:hypothetical protein
MLYSFAFKRFNLQEVEQAVLVLQEITDELGYMSVLLNLKEILSE